ncbi:relaxase/mobilization nuclease domain-containing protein, partial [uncultured Duncaniella sp.]|uniref:relaxase/mobilization nuclease domain-containing protein n=1 Tax=uncultured Duncaniella sp. TaxID=2768039 RepID=UPI00265F276D
MVAKISIGSSLYGALCYNGEKVNKENGRILGSNKIIIPVDGKADIGQMAENFRMFMPKMGKTKKPVLHISLNPHPDDRLSDQDFEILAREYLDKLGFGEQPYVIYKHEDIDRHHIHIVTVNVNEEGKRLNQDFLYRRSKKITTELEEKYNLHKAQREKISPDTPITKIDPNGDIKRQVANTVKMVGMRYKFQSMGEYNAILGLYNVRCDTADGRVNGREYHGLVYFATDDNGNTIAT